MKEYDKLSIRLVYILSKFNNGESVSIEEIVQEFNVDTIIIQRDLNERLNFMPIKKIKLKICFRNLCFGKIKL